MFWQGANVVVLASKVVPETPQSNAFAAFFGSLGRRLGHLDTPLASQSPSEKFSIFLMKFLSGEGDGGGRVQFFFV